MGKHSRNVAAGTAVLRNAAVAIAALCLAALVALSGCGEPATTYQVPGACISAGQKVMIMPFMDTRTFTDSGDPHKEDLGEHARTIFAEALRENADYPGAEIIAPALDRPDRSLSNAELADYGRANGADVVVAGQIFSFTGTRAASIPPRAGMFVRVVSVKDGTLLFVGDHYQSAPIPGASGGRDLQAMQVSARLVQGIIPKVNQTASRRGARSNTALATLIAPSRNPLAGNRGAVQPDAAGDDFLPEPPPFIGFAGGALNPNFWNDNLIPEAPPSLDFGDDLYRVPETVEEEAEAEMTASSVNEAEIGAENVLASDMPDDSTADDADTEVVVDPAEIPDAVDIPRMGGDDPAADLVADPAETDDVVDISDPVGSVDPVPAADATGMANAAAPEEDYDDDGEYGYADEGDYWHEEYSTEILDASHAARLTGDQLAADLFAAEGEVLPTPNDGEPPAVAAMASLIEAVDADEAVDGDMTDVAGVFDPAENVTPAVVEAEPPQAAADGTVDVAAEPVELAMAYVDDGPVFSTPVAYEQPRPYKTANQSASSANRQAAGVNFRSEVMASEAVPSEPVKVLLLPYHDRENPNNLITHTGGGEVVTTLYGTQLAMQPTLQILWDGSGQATHDRLVDREEAVAMGRIAGAEYVVRGQVVEFRRAQSVPSFYSAVISTAVLAAQMFFAEMSGVDVATEVYRVSDGACVMSRRDRAQQKYVVQAEKTVRRLSTGMAAGVAKAIQSPNPEVMDPLIDTLSPLTVLGNPR